MTPLTGDLGKAGLQVLERYADPRALLAAGPAELTALISAASRGQQGKARAREWIAAAQAATGLNGPDDPAVPSADLAAEVATGIRLLKAVQAELTTHAVARENAYRQADPGQIARTLPGLCEVGGPAMTAIMGKPARFATGHHFKSFLGLAPRASETGDTDRKGEPMTKAGPSLGRATMIRAADTARKPGPQLARIYYVQMTERGANHLKACCVVAGHLALRLHAVRCPAAPPTSSATPTARPSPPGRPGRSSPRTGPSPTTSANAAAAARKLAGRPLSRPHGPADEAALPLQDQIEPLYSPGWLPRLQARQARAASRVPPENTRARFTQPSCDDQQPSAGVCGRNGSWP